MNTFQECINYSKYGGLDFNRLRSGPFEGPAIVIPPALPEDTYYFGNNIIIDNGLKSCTFVKINGLLLSGRLQ
jgi:hypothetical protein